MYFKFPIQISKIFTLPVFGRCMYCVRNLMSLYADELHRLIMGLMVCSD